MKKLLLAILALGLFSTAFIQPAYDYRMKGMLLDAPSTDWVDVTLNPGWTGQAAYRKDSCGNVYLWGVISFDGVGDQVAFTLPIDYRPDRVLTLPTRYFTYYSSEKIWLVIPTTGEIAHFNRVATTYDTIYLDGVVFRAE